MGGIGHLAHSRGLPRKSTAKSIDWEPGGTPGKRGNLESAFTCRKLKDNLKDNIEFEADAGLLPGMARVAV
jgi:hypothetical protein